MASKPAEFNPFVQSLEIGAVWKMTRVNVSGEEGATTGTDAHSRLVDTDDRCSLYTKHLLNWYPTLSTSAKDMILWIAAHLGWEKDIIEMEDEKYCEEMAVSRSTFFNARNQITDRIILPRKARKNTYWVNPAYLFKGNRVKIFPQQVKPTNEDPIRKFYKESKTDNHEGTHSTPESM